MVASCHELEIVEATICGELSASQYSAVSRANKRRLAVVSHTRDSPTLVFNVLAKGFHRKDVKQTTDRRSPGVRDSASSTYQTDGIRRHRVALTKVR
jgi:hypothetical protein